MISGYSLSVTDFLKKISKFQFRIAGLTKFIFPYTGPKYAQQYRRFDRWWSELGSLPEIHYHRAAAAVKRKLCDYYSVVW